jgi:hypothetical protein
MPSETPTKSTGISLEPLFLSLVAQTRVNDIKILETLSYYDNKQNVITFCRVWLGGWIENLQYFGWLVTLVLLVDLFCHILPINRSHIYFKTVRSKFVDFDLCVTKN